MCSTVDILGLGKYVGFVTAPFREEKPATHALVFILRGISHSWKQTVAYYFTGNSTPGDLLWTVGSCFFLLLYILGHCMDNIESDVERLKKN